MIHLALPYAVAAALIGIGSYGVLARRNAVLVLIGIELMLGGAGLLLITAGATGRDTWAAGNVLTLFVITIAAAEVVVALAVILAVFRARGRIDVTDALGSECQLATEAAPGGSPGAVPAGPSLDAASAGAPTRPAP
ncbi:MAG TPA: NADH-quinone oxidoreductase subunit NuoK [Tetrasphaera sp.]|uniref:NADH-quinone oxidoreductase subunit NuoK n=1 Tax=Nostocoides sp. TaxID=1917966 RepID=UPI002C489E32|nr:NADH-quinone oxidoreductase subunit NuoK [Tetrasphaera sp.]HNQ08139.1 NADH-quinone oxidoreductase subunit NuoK [Tetrasphaera sp.]